MDMISHAKGDEKLLNEGLRQRWRRQSYHTKGSDDSLIREDFQCKRKGYLQKVSKFGKINTRAQGWGDLRKVSSWG